ncbi:hypothetical protein P154DRAFT_527052 [Amniculicola lignicola CBS 123094]|uniref:Uncharacterized protein n=1 Tax=Amniculicola lignicola CBS 123094 TaxID=1392246 RepID=A0A6A5VXM6_9PLEO|nr:hypothetical protein P154DRAFT_527052 [Amniculicola lignicola CBS 123094]
MCHYFEATIKYKECEKDPNHVVKTTRYNRCDEARETGFVCVNATPAKGKNGQVIQMGTSTQPGKCPACLS